MVRIFGPDRIDPDTNPDPANELFGRRRQSFPLTRGAPGSTVRRIEHALTDE